MKIATSNDLLARLDRARADDSEAYRDYVRASETWASDPTCSNGRALARADKRQRRTRERLRRLEAALRFCR